MGWYVRSSMDVRPGVARLARALTTVMVMAAPVFAGCAGATQNVRAYRAYAHEDASIRVSLDRIEDMARTLELVDRILVGTPYTPGDIWVRRLPLRDADARALKADIKDSNPYNTGEYEVPVLKIYRKWIEHVFDEYQAPPEKAMYPSLLDAVSGLVPRAPGVKAHWVTYRDSIEELGLAVEEQSKLDDELSGLDEASRAKRAPEMTAANRRVDVAKGMCDVAKRDLQKDAELMAADAALSGADKKQVARDCLAAMSVAFRVELEALALMPIVAIQTIRALPGIHHDIVNKPTLKTVRQVWQLPSYISGIKERMTRQIIVLEGMTKVLAQALQTSLDDSPGFELHESVVDQIVGITLDSFRLDLKAGGDMYIFSSIGTSQYQKTTDKNGNVTETVDYSGRQYKLDYRIKPIILAQARLDLVLDWIQLPGAANLGFGYSTDRVYRSGGTVESSSLSKQLGIKGAASDVFDFGIGLLGISTWATIAKWNAGEIRKTGATDGIAVETSPLQLQQTTLFVGYDVLFAISDPKIKAYVEQIWVGFKYYKYTLPRILYELQNTSTDPNVKNFTYSRETPPQAVDSTYYMAGIITKFGQGEAPRFSPWLDIMLFGGAGPTSFYFLRDPAGGDVEANHDTVKQAAFVFNGGVTAGVRWRLLPRGFRLRLDLRAQYHADFIYTAIHRSNTDSGAERRTDFGAVDVFHGPSIAIRGAL